MRNFSSDLILAFVIFAFLVAGGCASAHRSRQTDKPLTASENLERARWNTSHENPERNYHDALKHLELSVSINPKIGETDFVRDWMPVLRELDRLKQKVNQLTKENRDLKESVEKLKNLELKTEEKRKQFK